jgi:hypothetical protein
MQLTESNQLTNQNFNMKQRRPERNVHNLDMIRKYNKEMYSNLGKAIEQFVCMKTTRHGYDYRVRIAAIANNVTQSLLKHALERYYGWFEKPVDVSFYQEITGDVAMFVHHKGKFE